MFNKLTLLLAGSLALMTCSKQSNKPEAVKELIAEAQPFTHVLDTLEQMPIPISLTPDSWSDLYTKHIHKYGTGSGHRPTDHPYAKLTENENFKAFIFVTQDETGSPIIITFDRNGNIIDNLMLMGDWSGSDPSYGASELVTIGHDLTIHLLDSIRTFDLGPEGERIDSTEHLEVQDEVYKITDSGKIEKIR